MTSLRSQLDVYERISSKGLSDPTLEPILSTIADPFSAYGPPRNDEQIFSILGQNNLTSVSPVGSGSQSAKGDAVTTSGVMSQLIMSPSTPAKGLSRVASGATSPLLNDDGSSNGLGISLTAAATLARQNKVNATQASVDLFGTDGEDEGEDEASIFSGTEEEVGSSKAAKQSSAGEMEDGEAPSTGGTAQKLMKEKKKRRDRAVRANAKTRLKNSLSIIDESKGGPGAAARGALEARDVNVESEVEADQTVTIDDNGRAAGWWS